MFETAMQKNLIRAVSLEILSRIQRQVKDRSYRAITRMDDDELATETYVKHMFILGAAAAIYETKLQLSLKGIPDDNSCVRHWMFAYRMLLQRFIGSGHFSLAREMAAFKKQIIDYYYIFCKVDYDMGLLERERVAAQYFFSKLSGRRLFFSREYKAQEPWLLQYMDAIMQLASGHLSEYFDASAHMALCFSC